MNDVKRTTKLISNHPLYVGLFFIIILIGVIILNFRKYDISSTLAEWGQLGDFFGGVLNPFFGLISLVIISETLRSQIKASKKQEFDNQFFSLLNLYDSILKSIESEKSEQGNVSNGRYCFHLFYKNIVKTAKEDKITIDLAYIKFFQEKGWVIEHYYRTVYHLFKHVKDGHDVNDIEKKKYYDLIKSQISEYELILLWLNCQSQHKGKWDLLISDLHSNPFEHLNKCLLMVSE